MSSSANPLGSWTIYRLPVQDDGTQGTPDHANCPCLGDYPHIGADEHGIYLTTNEFPFAGGFNAAQIYALSKKDLVRGAVSVTVVQIDTADHLLEGNPGFTVWPAVSPAGDFASANRGTEFFLSSIAVFADSGNANRLRVWALGNTKSLDTNHPDVTLVDSTVQVRHYGVPPLSNQRPGPTPWRTASTTTLATPFGPGCWQFFFNPPRPPLAVAPELIDSNDSRMQQVFYAGGRLYGALDTVVNVGGGQQAGIAYYAIRPYAHNGSVIGVVENEGKIGVAGNNVTYPAIAALPDGRGIIAFTLVGADHFPRRPTSTSARTATKDRSASPPTARARRRLHRLRGLQPGDLERALGRLRRSRRRQRRILDRLGIHRPKLHAGTVHRSSLRQLRRHARVARQLVHPTQPRHALRRLSDAARAPATAARSAPAGAAWWALRLQRPSAASGRAALGKAPLSSAGRCVSSQAAAAAPHQTTPSQGRIGA